VKAKKTAKKTFEMSPALTQRKRRENTEKTQRTVCLLKRLLVFSLRTSPAPRLCVENTLFELLLSSPRRLSWLISITFDFGAPLPYNGGSFCGIISSRRR
jgi:hypothetical protein